MAMRRPAEAFHPGEFLRDELEERGWTQEDFADILGRPASLVNEIVMGKRGISPETARGFAAAFEMSAEYWMNLDAAYQLWRVRTNDSEAITRRAKIYSKGPIKEMMRRGWIEPSDSIEVLEHRVAAFFQLTSIDDTPRLPVQVAARMSTSYREAFTLAQTAWLFRARQLAQAVYTEGYAPEKLGRVHEQLRLLMHAPEEIRHVPRILAEAGIRFVVIEPLKGTKIDGACFWPEDEPPIVAMSIRFDRIDNFWFTLMHELAHVKNRDRFSLDLDVDASKEDDNRSEFEKSADRLAAESLVPQDRMTNFIARVGPVFSRQRIEAFALLLQVHPGIVVGQLHHRVDNMWSNFRRMLVPIREIIISAALTDGWGARLPSTL